MIDNLSRYCLYPIDFRTTCALRSVCCQATRGSVTGNETPKEKTWSAYKYSQFVCESQCADRRNQ
jgi:hypothetical protein